MVMWREMGRMKKKGRETSGGSDPDGAAKGLHMLFSVRAGVGKQDNSLTGEVTHYCKMTDPTIVLRLLWWKTTKKQPTFEQLKMYIIKSRKADEEDVVMLNNLTPNKNDVGELKMQIQELKMKEVKTKVLEESNEEEVVEEEVEEEEEEDDDEEEEEEDEGGDNDAEEEDGEKDGDEQGGVEEDEEQREKGKEQEEDEDTNEEEQETKEDYRSYGGKSFEGGSRDC
ncbi:hypothetical protein D8674_017664 [Pyrus ussuriensis x Pyrus communis]|uniref:Uncharacterized protein n=1 Tax=Pyrus ussuriensis x Pyrus communis TaxID=2448454 RepID=A0A5N5HRK9_9ROSA|nr:hypothetical protein D8674_017664 [Pyrus ussuriensis x Pyrus communis]